MSLQPNLKNSLIKKLLSESDAQKVVQSLLDLCVDEYYDEAWLSERWKVSVKLIQRMRNQGNGPPFCKIGTLVRYSLSDVIEYEAKYKKNNTCN